MSGRLSTPLPSVPPLNCKTFIQQFRDCMGHRLSRIYTRTGDDGSTGLGDGMRIEKDAPRIECIGSIDELNSILGMVLAHSIPTRITDGLNRIQHHLFDLGGELSIPGHEMIRQEHVDWLEQRLDQLNEDLPMLKEFILPAGGPATASCHLARSVCRRTERRLVSLQRTETVSHQALKYLNRLSDLLFVIARVLVRHEHGGEVLWQKSVLDD